MYNGASVRWIMSTGGTLYHSNLDAYICCPKENNKRKVPFREMIAFVVSLFQRKKNHCFENL